MQTPWEDVGYRCPLPGFFLGDDRGSAGGTLQDTNAVLLENKSLPPSWDLGRLSVLPLELLHQIVAELAESDARGLVGLIALRNTNHATAAVVDSWPDFATVAAFPRALAALVMLARGAVSLRTLAACLRSTDCASCLRNDINNQNSPATHGDCIYLLTPERVCYSCVRSRPEYLPVSRFVAAEATSAPRPAELSSSRSSSSSSSQLTSLHVPSGRYGVLTRLGQAVDLYDRRQMEAEAKAQAKATEGMLSQRMLPNVAGPHLHLLPSPSKPGTLSRPARPNPLRYAAVIPGPYWDNGINSDGFSKNNGVSSPILPPTRALACRACAATDRSSGHAGWMDPLARYTRKGLQMHVEDPRLGGRVLWRRDFRTGAEIFLHDAPRQSRFPPPAECGATVDFGRRYQEAVI